MAVRTVAYDQEIFPGVRAVTDFTDLCQEWIR
jgi:hypothetical protein